MIREDSKAKNDKDKDEDDDDEGPSKEDRLKRLINSGRDKKFVDKEKPMRGVKKKPMRPRIEWDADEDYGYLEEVID